MARIRTYPVESTDDISVNDYLLGNDGDNGSVITKRFPLANLKEFILEGTEIDILRQVPPRNLIVVDETGEDVTRAPLQVTYTPIGAGNERLNEDGHLPLLNEGELGSVIDYYTDGNGTPYIEFVNYNLEYTLFGFVGSTFNFNTVNGGSEVVDAISATVAEYIPYNPATSIDSEGNTRDRFRLEFGDIIPVNATQGPNLVTRLVVAEVNPVTGNFATLSELEMSSLVITGGLDIDGDLSVGSDEDRANIDLSGFLQMNDPAEGLRFGSETHNITFTSDGNGQLSIDALGDGMVTFNTPVNLAAGVNLSSIEFAGDTTTTIVDDTGIRLINNLDNTTKVLQTVTANDTSGSTGALLTSINIDDVTYPLPSFDASAVIEAFPGLNEALSGPSEEITTGTFFYGTQQANEVTPTSPIATNIPSITIPEGATSVTIDGAIKTAFDAWYDLANTDIPFFLETGEVATAGVVIDSLTTNVYMVVGYNETTGVITLGLLGSGAVNISSQTFNLSSAEIIVANLPEEDEAVFNFVTVGTDNILSKSELDISGAANGVRYTAEGEIDQPLSGLTFLGDHNIEVNTMTNTVELDISGRYIQPTAGAVHTASYTTQLWTLNILDTVSADSVLTLPVAQAFGDSIKVVNLSTITDTGDTSSNPWTIMPGGQQTIMKQSPGEVITLDDSTASFEMVWSGDATTGWVIIGLD